MSSSPLSYRLTRSFGVLLVLLLSLVGFSLFNFQALSEANKLNIHTYKVITHALQLEQTLLAIDSGARGFIVAGEKSALQSYRSQLVTYSKRWQFIYKLTEDNPTQSANLKELNDRKEKWIKDFLEVLIAQRQRTRDPNEQLSAAARSTLPRRAAIRELQKITNRITATEEMLLLERTREQQRLKWWTQFTLISGSAASVFLTGFLAFFASQGARHLDRTNTLLQEAKSRAEASNQKLLQINERLESEVKARRQSDERLRRSVVDLQRSNTELEQFAYVASHDLQEPLRAVAGCVQVLKRRYEGKLDERADQFIQHAVDGALRMQNLIDDLLAYSRAGIQNQALESVNGAQIVDAALEKVSVSLRESGAQIAVDEMPALLCNRAQIEQVLQNLLSNALKFRGETPPRIHVGYATLRENDLDFHVLSVEDDGVGIEPQYFERIFVMFQRLHSRVEYSGTGIGLAICKKIVERHGGKIWVESWHQKTAGSGGKHGSKFAFSLPFKPEVFEHAPDLDEETATEFSGAETAARNGTLIV